MEILNTILIVDSCASKRCCVFLSLVNDNFQWHRRLHVFDTSLHWYNENIRILGIICYFLNEHLVSLIMPVITKEPSSMHVKPPWSLVSLDEDSQICIFFSQIHSVEVLHQHIVDTLWSKRFLRTAKFESQEFVNLTPLLTWCKHLTYCIHCHNCHHIQPSTHPQDQSLAVPTLLSMNIQGRVQLDSLAWFCNQVCRGIAHILHQHSQIFLLARYNHRESCCHTTF